MTMDQAMRLPFKVSTTTSNFMIGVTAAPARASPSPYIDPDSGCRWCWERSLADARGSRAERRQDELNRAIFVWVIVGLALEMLYSGVTGKV